MPYLRTFRSRLISALLILSIPPFAALGVLAISSSRQALKRSIASGVAGAASKYVAFAGSWVHERQEDLQMLPDDWSSNPQHHIAAWLLKIRTAQPAYRSLYVADRQGNVILAIQAGTSLNRVSNQQFFRTALSGKAFASDVELDARTGRPQVLMAAPLPGGLEISGVLVTVVDLSDLHRELHGLSLGQTGEALIINGRGEVVASSKAGGAGRTPDLSRLLSLPQGKLREYRDRDGTPTIGIYREIPNLSATLVIKQDAREAFAPVGRFTVLLVLGLIAGLVAVTGVGTLLASHFCHPLAELRLAALRFGAGERTKRAAERGPGEIRELARAFNTMAEHLQRSQEKLDRQQLLAHLCRAQEDERHRVAMDLHDGPTQKVSAAALSLETCRELFRTDPVSALARTSDVEKVLRASVDDMRELVQDLRPATLEDKGLITAITQQVREVALAANIEPHVLTPADNVSLDQQTAAAAFRVVQEALSNVRKHSGAANLWVEMGTVDSTFRIEIRDDGRGFTPGDDGHASPRHFGLMGMRERAQMIGGALDITSTPGAGTTVTLKIPIADC